MSICRQMPFAVADGPYNMAADEVLLESAAGGIASLRFYGWSEATLSLGYFQPERLRREDAALRALPYVRRPSGGATLVHHHELTYALALPAGPPWQTGAPWLERMHRIIAAALAGVGVACHGHEPVGDQPFPGFLCFHHFTAGDLIIGAAKVAGSAQRRQRRALLQHGAILLASSPFTPHLPGIHELTGQRVSPENTAAAVTRAFCRDSGWELSRSDLTPHECRQVAHLVATKYTQDVWNRKR